MANDQANASDDSPHYLPYVVLALIFLVLTARWIWIAGIGDYGWVYELGMRIKEGEIPYRDYISTLPQLTSYTIVPFLTLLEGNLWALGLHLYLWWLSSLLVGLAVMRCLGVSTSTQSAALFLAACISFPPISLGHAYSYAGTVFFGLVLVCGLKYISAPKVGLVYAAGTFAALAVFAKQNIGVVTVLLGVGWTIFTAFQEGRLRQVARSLPWFIGGFVTIFLPIFTFFAVHAGWSEVLRQMFLDAGEGKGGIAGMIFHTLPLLFFTPETPHRHALTIFVSIVTYVAFFGFFGFTRFVAQPEIEIQRQVRAARHSSAIFPLAGIGIVALLSGVSLLNLPALKQTLGNLCPAFLYPSQTFVGPIIFLFYSATLALTLVIGLTLRFWRTPALALAVVALPLLVCGHELSAQLFFPFGAPVAIPLALFLVEKHLLLPKTDQLACLTGMIVMSVYLFFPQATYNTPTFEPIYPLPQQTRFAGLYATKRYAAWVSETVHNVSARIQGRRTLWLCFDGPHQAYGGKSVRSIALLHSDTYNARSELSLLEEWQRRPPDFVFVAYFTPSAGSRYLTQDFLFPWLGERYRKVWENPICNASLWEFRENDPK